MNTARFLMPIFTLHDFLYLLLDFLLAGFFWGFSSFNSISLIFKICVAHATVL
jgi:hypothetical protein